MLAPIIPLQGHSSQYIHKHQWKKNRAIGGSVGGNMVYMEHSTELREVRAGTWSSWNRITEIAGGHMATVRQPIANLAAKTSKQVCFESWTAIPPGRKEWWQHPIFIGRRITYILLCKLCHVPHRGQRYVNTACHSHVPVTMPDNVTMPF